MLKIALYELKKLTRDTRWLVLFLVQPILVVLFLGLVTWREPQNIRVSFFNKEDNQYSQQIVQDLEREKKLILVYDSSADEAHRQVKDNITRSAVIIDIAKKNDIISGSIEIMENSTLPELSGQTKKIILKATEDTVKNFSVENVKNLMPQSAQIKIDETNIDLSPIEIRETKNTNKNIKYFDYFLSALIVLLITINCLNLSSTTITTERIEGTFERFFVTPFKKYHMIIGKLLAFAIVAIVLSIIIILTLKTLFAVTLGPIWLVLLITFITALMAIALGIFISSITYTIRESILMGIMAFYLTLILTPFLFQSETMHPIIGKIPLIIPFTYSIKAMREVNILGFDFYQILPDLLMLVGYFVGFIILSILLLRRRAV